ncbi:polyketide synthase, partial [Streptomyces sp. SID2955]|nr:polyketide synthase [Streptomyces sp. SID2955]
TYAFQRERYWLEPVPAAGDVASVGLGAADHPLLGAAVTLPDSDGCLFTGRLSARTHPWLVDHAVLGAVLVPGTAFVDLALHAGARFGCTRVDDLVLEAPLVLPETGAVQLQVVVGGPDDTGRRSVNVYARQESGDPDQPWTRHVGAVVTESAVEAAESVSDEPGVWPPTGAEALDIEGMYERFASGGLVYGPVFQGVRAAWRRGTEVFAEVALPQEHTAEAVRFGLHPALLDAAMHVAGPGGLTEPDGEDRHQIRLPFVWNGVRLYATGASTVRVRLSSAGADGVSAVVADESGRLVASVGELVTRPVTAEQIDTARGAALRDSLFRLAWHAMPLPASEVPPALRCAVVGEPDGPGLAACLRSGGWDVAVHADLKSLGEADTGTDAQGDGTAVPEWVLLSVPGAPGTGTGAGTGTGTGAGIGGGERLHSAVAGTLAWVQDWLADDRFADARLVVVTQGAVNTSPLAADPAEQAVQDMVGAAVWGLVRSAQAEHPDRLLLLDTDDPSAFASAPVAAALASGEPQLAVRAGRVLLPRLVRAADDGPAAHNAPTVHNAPTAEYAPTTTAGGSTTTGSSASVPAAPAAPAAPAG